MIIIVIASTLVRRGGTPNATRRPAPASLSSPPKSGNSNATASAYAAGSEGRGPPRSVFVIWKGRSGPPSSRRTRTALGGLVEGAQRGPSQRPGGAQTATSRRPGQRPPAASVGSTAEPGDNGAMSSVASVALMQSVVEIEQH